MRNRFEQQYEIGTLPIEETRIPLKCKDSLIDLLAALKAIYVNKHYSNQIFDILSETIIANKKSTGRKGMNLWQIFVLSQIRLCLNIGYDTLQRHANNDKMVRQIMGVEKESGFEQIEYEYQQIYDNVTLLDDATLKRLNSIIVDFGHEVFKKKETEALRLKTDSFVVESCVHFPTDYNLLWDCIRKCLDGIEKILKKYNPPGWRKINNWRYENKGLMRELGKTSASGGKNKEERLKKVAGDYIAKATALLGKIKADLPLFPINDYNDLSTYIMIEKFAELMKKHIDMVYQRIIEGKIIPHDEKLFSVFETYTEMILKGKSRPNVELGMKVAITTDQYHLIVDHRIMPNEQDRDIVVKLADDILPRHHVQSWSFDKGFWNKDNKEILKLVIPEVIMAKLGKLNLKEQEEEGARNFKKLKNKHSAVESNINELECRGLDRCPDRGLKNFTRYISLGVCAYNLKKIGHQILEENRKEIKDKRVIYKSAA